MAVPIFSAFNSTVTTFWERLVSAGDRWLVHPITGAIVGVKNPSATGADARFTPVDITAAQLTAPTAAMIADLDATYRLNVAPYSRFQSDGTQIVAIGGANETETVIPAGFNYVFDAPLTISTPQILVVEGGVRVS